jgi:hypothetical protein
MKKFLISILIFIIPFLIFFSLPTYILYKSKENFYNIDKLLSSNHNYLIGYSYNQNNYGYLKWSYLNLNENKFVWTLGSSRVLQFRKEMFDTTFYNAGYTISSISDFRPFLKSLPDFKKPKYLILGLDQWMFNESYDSLNTIPSTENWQKSFSFVPKPYPTYKSVYTDLYVGKYNLSLISDNNNSFYKIGLHANISNTGLRNDGSFFYGDQIKKLINNDKTANDYNYSDTYDRIEKGDRRFQFGQSVNNKAVLELNELLKYCKSQQINVIAFLPPFADKVYQQMINSRKYPYLENIFNSIKPIFDNHNYEIYDFSMVSLCGSNDNETIDGFHGGDVTYQKILISMLDSMSILNKVTNINRLKNDMIYKKNNYLIYD